jgi:undecaprenyl-diphosphatase
MPGSVFQFTETYSNIILFLDKSAIFGFKAWMIEWIIIIILGIIEGITEFLPVSSTAHLLIAEHWLPHQSDLFNIVIQSGAVIAVLPLFPERLHQFAFQWREKPTQDYAFKLLAAFVITGIGGLLLTKAGFKLPEELWPVAWALLLGGIGFLLIEKWIHGKRPTGSVTWSVAVVVGIGQLVAAVFPGASRSGVTILLMLMMGLSRPAATEFSFLVGIPTMLAAGGLKIFQALHHLQPGTPHEDWGLVMLGLIVSALVSFITVKWLLNYIRTHTFIVFGWYRIALAAGIFCMLMRY